MENATQGVQEEELSLDGLIKEEAHKKTRKIAYLSIISVVLIGTASFGLGRLTKVVGEREPIRIELPSAEVLGASANIQTVTSSNLETESLSAGKYGASKSGTKYHLPWCAGAKSIKEENKIWFDTKDEAEKAGYTPAANCKGI